MNIANLLRNDLKTFTTYKPSPTLESEARELGIPVEKIAKLDTGENYTAPISGVKTAFGSISSVAAYPDPYSSTLTEAISGYCGVSKNQIVCGNGSDELIDLVARAFLEPGDQAIIPEPTFSMYQFYTKLNRGKVIQVNRNPDLSLNIQNILNAVNDQTKIIWIASPNNPAGAWTNQEDIEKLLKMNCIVVVDEAYYEFCENTVVPLLNKYPNLIILRSFSKWAGLAGLRIGYLLANAKIVTKIQIIKPPYNTNTAAQTAAFYVLENIDLFIKQLKDLVQERNRLMKECTKLTNVEVLPSDSIYFIVKLKSKKAKEVQLDLKKKGILVKVIDTAFLPNSIRATPGKTREEGNRFLSALKATLTKSEKNVTNDQTCSLSLNESSARPPQPKPWFFAKAHKKASIKDRNAIKKKRSPVSFPYLFDYHIQTLDHGANKLPRVEEIIEAAINRGLSAICLTDHYPLPPGFVDPTPDKDCAMSMTKYKEYRQQMNKAKKKYGDRLKIFVGAEFDWLPEYQEWTKKQLRKWLFDYTIGSVHFLGKIVDAKGERNFLIDYTEEELRQGIAFYGGLKKLIKSYYSQVNSMILSGLFNSVGHLDLIKKFNNGRMFDENEDWYQIIVKQTLDVLAGSKMTLEINTAGWQKKCKTPYPSFWILKEAKKRKIPITIGSDAHTPEEVGKNLELATKLAKKAGYDSINKFIKRRRIKIPI